MANRKHTNTKEEKASQKRRTYKNLAKKYRTLLDKKPKDPHARKWHELWEYYKIN